MGSRRHHGRALLDARRLGANTLVPQEVDAVAARNFRDQIDPNAPDPSPIEPFVVTERQGAHHLNQEGLAQLNGTTVISDLKDLTGLLVAHSTN